MRFTAEEGKKLLEELGDKVTLIDIRHSFEYEAGHFLFAILMLLVFVAAFTVLARAALRRIREDR